MSLTLNIITTNNSVGYAVYRPKMKNTCSVVVTLCNIITKPPCQQNCQFLTNQCT